jgi:hypothetical protein
MHDDIENLIISEYLQDPEAIKYFRTNKNKYQKLSKYSGKERYILFDRKDPEFKVSKDPERKYIQGPVNFILKNLIVKDPNDEFLKNVEENLTELHLLYDNPTYISFKNFKKLEVLSILTFYNRKISDLPKNLKSLGLGNSFNQRLDNLPETLESLQIGNKFNQPLNNLPPQLERLQLGNKFNQPLDNLPSGLQRLCFGDNFNQPLNIPKTLITLEVGNKFNKKLTNLPESLRCIKFGENSNYKHGLPSEFRNITDFYYLKYEYLCELTDIQYQASMVYFKNFMPEEYQSVQNMEEWIEEQIIHAVENGIEMPVFMESLKEILEERFDEDMIGDIIYEMGQEYFE